MILRAVLPALLLAVACAPESVQSVTLTPEGPRADEIEALLRAADARWEAAGVGVDRIIVGPGGAPVRFVPERGGREAEERRWFTRWKGSRAQASGRAARCFEH